MRDDTVKFWSAFLIGLALGLVYVLLNYTQDDFLQEIDEPAPRVHAFRGLSEGEIDELVALWSAAREMSQISHKTFENLFPLTFHQFSEYRAVSKDSEF